MRLFAGLILFLLLLLPALGFAIHFEIEDVSVYEERYDADVASLEELANQGNTKAQYQLGVLYLRGQEVDRNVFEAIRWFHMAAEKGHLKAQFSLGRAYATGKAVDEAVIWYTKAAEGGHPMAQNNLGRMYATGEGVQKDYVQAYKWWLLSSGQGDRAAERNRRKLKKRLTPEQIAEAKKMAGQVK